MSRKTRKANNIIKAIILVLVLLIIAVIMIFRQINLSSKETIIKNDVEIAIEKTATQFPYDLGDGVIVESLFQFTGTNPDCENQEGENIASISVRNESDKLLDQVKVEVTLDSGDTLNFEIEDMPAESVVNTFEKNNKNYELTDVCTDVNGKIEFSNKDQDITELFEIREEETTVTIINLSEKDLKELVVHCHCSLGDTYFGGLTYKYPVDKISSGESVTIEALDCYLGEADVVKISKK